ncbi:IclR family transcriptional regulator [Actinomycetospora endophytica]|uniref:IclR family transcriptional regulator n=1 Tax=Actinomycetospora endophytica TaxID=2291215 RepID=A0ABS8PJB0_9PSEU|nr:IclR family transcriptional regulator [Actinomycetospora endophytica]MCD2198148.1 IclR family transcriptional regulator [Actinomycetospora endophytica]
MKNEPVYRIQSVDHALHLATVLAQEGPLRLSEAAERLGVARSTAHRLLAMLVYRDFAEQDEDRRYVAGPVLRAAQAPEPQADLRRVALPRLRALTERLDETSNLVVVVGDRARFVASVECDRVLRVGEREGRVLPAHLASGARAVLATLAEAEIRALYDTPDSPVADVDRLLRELRRIRRQRFALNDQQTEAGVSAIGAAVPGDVRAGVSVALPTARYRRDRLPEWAAEVTATAERIGADLAGR